jgi:dTDP-4-dehydrorhamnose reductase
MEKMRLALIGGKGMLAQAVTGMTPPDYELVSFDLPDFDITDRNQVLSVLAELRPEVIINCAAFTNVDGCETQEELANFVNGTAVGYLAAAAKEVGATLVHISTDYVFAGNKGTPYLEEDATHPLSAYGRSKRMGEQAILDSGLERFFIIRTSWLYGPGGKNFVETIIRLGKEREELRVVADQIGCPTFTRDLAAAIFNLLKLDRAHGIYHFANAGQCSWHEFAVAIVDEAIAAGETIVAQRVVPIRSEEYPLPAPRPAWSVFSKGKYKAATGAAVPDWRKSLREYFGNR